MLLRVLDEVMDAQDRILLRPSLAVWFGRLVDTVLHLLVFYWTYEHLPSTVPVNIKVIINISYWNQHLMKRKYLINADFNGYELECLAWKKTEEVNLK